MGNLTFDTLKDLAAKGEVDTVLVALVDMQGRLMGKRFHVTNFIDHSHAETHCCNYLLATDLVMSTPEGFASTSWETGYGDYVLRPDLSTMRRAGAWRCAGSPHPRTCLPFAARHAEKADRPSGCDGL